MSLVRQYYLLTKPGIIRGNLMTAAAGFLFASKGHIDIGLLAALLAGTALVIASGCVFNNYLDRTIDKKMDRTKKRALVTGAISTKNALLYGTFLGILGFTILSVYTNLVTVIVGVIGIVDYVVLYGIVKRKSVHSTLIGGISGATSLVAGYTAVTNSFDTIALLLFLIMAFWQMPHFHAIGIYRRKDYAAAGLPILSVKRGIAATKQQIIFYTLGYIVTVALLSLCGYAGYTYLAVMLLITGSWLYIALQGRNVKDNVKWAHKVFGVSLVVLLVFSVMISLDAWLP